MFRKKGLLKNFKWIFQWICEISKNTFFIEELWWLLLQKLRVSLRSSNFLIFIKASWFFRESLLSNFQYVGKKQAPVTVTEISFIKKETLAHAFSGEFCEICKNTFFWERFGATASGLISLLQSWHSKAIFKINFTFGGIRGCWGVFFKRNWTWILKERVPIVAAKLLKKSVKFLTSLKKELCQKYSRFCLLFRKTYFKVTYLSVTY